MRRAIVGLAMLSNVALAAPTPSKHEAGALVFTVDRSGSTYEELPSVKQAILGAMAALDPSDRISLVAFNFVATVVFEDVAVAQRAGTTKAIRKLAAEGGTSILAGLESAFEILQRSTQPRKHIIVLSEGPPDDYKPEQELVELVAKMHKAGITTSCVGIGEADRELLGLIAKTGGSRLRMVRSIKQLPKILRETAKEALK